MRTAVRKLRRSQGGIIITLYGAVRAVVINSTTVSYSTPTATGKSIAKAYQWLNRLAHAGLERLEPDDAKVSRPVLRGLRHEVAYVFVVLE